MINRTAYGYIFPLLLPLIVGYLAFNILSPVAFILTILSVCCVALPLVYCSLPGLNFLKALGYLSAKYCSGCANITLIYIWLPIGYYWLFGLAFSIQGLVKGKRFSQDKWRQSLYKWMPEIEYVLSPPLAGAPPVSSAGTSQGMSNSQ